MTIAGALATLSLMIAQPTDRPANDPPLIRIDQGELTGVADGDIAAFKNIPAGRRDAVAAAGDSPAMGRPSRRLDLWADLYPGHAAGRSRRRPSADERGLPEPERLAPS